MAEQFEIRGRRDVHHLRGGGRRVPRGQEQVASAQHEEQDADGARYRSAGQGDRRDDSHIGRTVSITFNQLFKKKTLHKLSALAP